MILDYLIWNRYLGNCRSEISYFFMDGFMNWSFDLFRGFAVDEFGMGIFIDIFYCMSHPSFSFSCLGWSKRWRIHENIDIRRFISGKFYLSIPLIHSTNGTISNPKPVKNIKQTIHLPKKGRKQHAMIEFFISHLAECGKLIVFVDLRMIIQNFLLFHLLIVLPNKRENSFVLIIQYNFFLF